MTTPTLAPMLAVTEYARRVRDQLGDLTADEVAELTDGMEADLVEALLELPGTDDDALPSLKQVEARFGPPDRYAAELRTAAGLPHAAGGTAGATGLGGLLSRFFDRERRIHSAWRERLTAQPWWPGARELALTMRPVWWVLRAYVLAMIGNGSGAFPSSTARWAVLLVLLVLSVQWGRGRLGAGRWVDGAGIVASVIAVIALLPVLASAGQARTVHVETWVEDPAEHWPGVFVDGEPVRSFHAYDAAGNLIEEFQLFDDRGRPVVTVPFADDEFYVGGSDEAWLASPPVDVYGQPVWNAYPLQMGRWEWLEWDEVEQRWVAREGSLLARSPAPFQQAIPLAAAAAEPDGAADAPDDDSPGAAADPGAGDDGGDPSAAESSDETEAGAESDADAGPDADDDGDDEAGGDAGRDAGRSARGSAAGKDRD